MASATSTGRRPPRILAIGGGGLTEASGVLDSHLAELTERDDPRVCLLPTSEPGATAQIARFYDVFGGRAQPSHLSLDRASEPPDLIRRHLLAQDAVYAGGGGLLNVLSRWRAHGVDRVLREAWQAGIVLAGQSAGSLCWFEAAVTAAGGQPRPARGLGLVPASNSVHWSAAPRRRRAFLDCIADGMPAGWGIDDGAALLFEGAELTGAVAGEHGPRAWRIEREGREVVETAVPVRVLGEPA
jgi:dipeptidase E